MEEIKTQPEEDRAEFLIGDEVFSLNRANIYKQAPNLLSMLLNNEENDRMKVEKDEDGRIIIRRAATFFPAIVTWLESSKIETRSLKWMQDKMREEAGFYNLSAMEKAIGSNDEAFSRFDGAYFPSKKDCYCSGNECTKGCDKMVFEKGIVHYNSESVPWQTTMVGIRANGNYTDFELIPTYGGDFVLFNHYYHKYIFTHLRDLRR